jgi:hypothetical protein
VTRPRNPLRRFERWFVGLGMAVIAFILERAVMRSVRRGGSKPDQQAAPTTFTSRGGDVDVE